MRLLNLSFLFGAVALVAGASSEPEEEDPMRENTYFNGKKVPPMLEITPANWEKEAKASKFLVVKHYRYSQLPNHLPHRAPPPFAC